MTANSITNTAPADAPDETPIKNGLANGFLVRVCTPTPAKDRFAPTMHDSNTRGNLIFQIILMVETFETDSK